MDRTALAPHERLIVALDVPDETGLARLLDVLRGKVGLYKIGKELFTALGPRAVELVRERGGKVFLDLKYHDIPNTVAGAVRAACRLGVSMLTVHAAGGRTMIRAAADAAREASAPPWIIAVTVLTSLGGGDLQEIGLAGDPQAVVERLGRLAIAAGADGLVASAREAAPLRAALGPGPLLVTPGIRPAGGESDDQARVATPAQAVADGADFLVIGRPITRAPDPAAAADGIARELGAAG